MFVCITQICARVDNYTTSIEQNVSCDCFWTIPCKRWIESLTNQRLAFIQRCTEISRIRRLNRFTRAHTHAHTRARTRTHTTHTHTHTHTRHTTHDTRIHARAHAHTHAHIHTYTWWYAYSQRTQRDVASSCTTFNTLCLYGEFVINKISCASKFGLHLGFSPTAAAERALAALFCSNCGRSVLFSYVLFYAALFWFALCCFALCCYALFCAVLCSVLFDPAFCPILSRHIPSCQILSCPVVSCPILRSLHCTVKNQLCKGLGVGKPCCGIVSFKFFYNISFQSNFMLSKRPKLCPRCAPNSTCTNKDILNSDCGGLSVCVTCMKASSFEVSQEPLTEWQARKQTKSDPQQQQHQQQHQNQLQQQQQQQQPIPVFICCGGVLYNR